MEESVAKHFRENVEEILEGDNEREALYSALTAFHQTSDLSALVREMRNLIKEPAKLLLYDNIRPLIPLKQQIEYDHYAPFRPNSKLKVVKMRRKGKENLGFAVRGGMEFGIGIYVSYVEAGSQADLLGLRVGDQIVRVNGFTIDQAIHEEVLNLIKNKNEIIMKVKRVGMLPIKQSTDENVSWHYVDNIDSSKTLQHILDLKSGKEIKLCFNLVGGMGLGCSICSGPFEQPGIFIQGVRKGSLADEGGLAVGDQILMVNESSFSNTTHQEAVMVLKSSKQLDITVRKTAGKDLFNPRSPTKKAEDLGELEQLKEIKEFDVQREKEKRAKLDNERTLLENEKQKELDEKRKNIEAQKLKEQINKQKREEDTRKKQEKQRRLKDEEEKEMMVQEINKREKRETDLRRQHKEQLSLVQEMQQELAEMKERERLEKEKGMLEEKQKEKQKRVRKEQELLVRLAEQEKKLAEKEVAMRQQRLSRDSEEYKREGERGRESNEIIQGIRSVELKHVPLEEQVASKRASLPRVTVQKTPSFKLQKPVLLNPEHKQDSSSPPPLEEEEEEAFDEYCFDPYKFFTNAQINGRHITLVDISKADLNDFQIEGGIDSPINKVVVSLVFDGALKSQGKIHLGDQIMMANAKTMLDIPLAEAQKILDDAVKSDKDLVSIVLAKSQFMAEENEMTYL